MKALICFFLALASLVAGNRAPRYGKLRESESRIGTSTRAATGVRERAPRVATSRKIRTSGFRSSTRCEDCQRDTHGRILRSAAARRAFRRATPCPATGLTTGACPGYVIDHINALKRGGKDEARNMQWQTKADAKAKDRVE